MKYATFAAILVWGLFLGMTLPARANDIEQKFIHAGLVDVNRIDHTIQVDLVNSDAKKNFFRENFYNGLKTAYLRKEVAIKLAKAQADLKSKHKNLSLQILDAARPRSVSSKMYEKMRGTPYERYVANPEKGAMHNYGIAVDITIVDKSGNELDMGFSPFRKSTPALYWQVAKMKLGFKPTKDQDDNRRLLADMMQRAGFLPLSHEWWHFNGMPKGEARKRFAIIE